MRYLYNSIFFFFILSISSTILAIPLGLIVKNGQIPTISHMIGILWSWKFALIVLFNLLSDAFYGLVFLVILDRIADLTPSFKTTAELAAMLFFGLVFLFILAEKRFGIIASIGRGGWHPANFYTSNIFDKKFAVYTFCCFQSFAPFIIYITVTVLLSYLTLFSRASIPFARRFISAEAEKPADKVAPFTTLGIAVSALAGIMKVVLEIYQSLS